MLHLYNTKSRSLEEFKPIEPGKVGIYACGPTVYGRAHIGNLRTYVFEDILVRFLRNQGNVVNHVMNITDVGHLVGDGDVGEDKVETTAKKLGKTAWEIAKGYEEQFFQDTVRLNVLKPTYTPRATDHIKEQIELIQHLEKQGHTYKTSDGIYFDVATFSEYGKLSGQSLEDKLAGARVEENEEKHHPADFALWKFSPAGEKRQMEWESPWGIGFPGWHIECSAMARHFLGQPFDIHCGGIDHVPVHHENEIAQSEAAFHEPLAHYWMHSEFLLIDGQKMSKSLNNVYTLKELDEHDIDPLALRLFFLGANYRQKLNFTWEAVTASQNTLKRLRSKVKGLENGVRPDEVFMKAFTEAISQDLNTSKALAIVHELLDSDLTPEIKGASITEMDKILGLDLAQWIGKIDEPLAVPSDIQELAEKRWQAKELKDFAEADRLRDELAKLGWKMKDGKDGFELEQG